MSTTVDQFHTTVHCKGCKTEIIVVGALNSNVTVTTGSENGLALNPEVTGSVLTTEGNKRDIKFDMDCPKCGNSETYQSLI